MKTAVGEVQGEALTLVNTTNTAIAASPARCRYWAPPLCWP